MTWHCQSRAVCRGHAHTFRGKLFDTPPVIFATYPGDMKKCLFSNPGHFTYCFPYAAVLPLDCQKLAKTALEIDWRSALCRSRLLIKFERHTVASCKQFRKAERWR